MATALGDLELRIRAPLDDLRRDLSGAQDQTRRAVDDTSRDVENRVGSTVKTIGKLLAAGTIAMGVKNFFGGGLDELKEGQEVAAQTSAALKSTGNAAKVSAGQIEELSGALSKKSAVDDALIQKGANLLLTFTNIRNEVGKGNDIFNQATAMTLDLSRALGTDVPAASMMLGKALNDPIKGIGALSKAGVALTEEQKTQIRVFQESGDTLSAQKIILAELTKQVGGSAEAYGKTLPGQIERAQNALGNLQGEIMGVAAPALSFLAEGAASLADTMGSLPPVAQTALVGLSGLALAAPAILSVKNALQSLTAGMAATSLTGAALQGAFIGAAKFAGIAGIAYFGSKMALDALGISSDATNKKMAAFSATLGRLSDQQLTATIAKVKTLDGEFRKVYLDKLLADFDEMARVAPASAQRVIDAMKSQGLETSALEAKLRGAVAGTKQFNADQQKSADILDTETTPALQTAEEALKGYDQALRDAFGSLQSVQAADLRLAEAEAALNVLRQEGTLKTGTSTEAQRNATQAALGLIGAIETQIDAKARDAAQTGISYDRHGELIRQLEAEKQKYPELRPFIDEYIGRLNQIPRVITTDHITRMWTEYANTPGAGVNKMGGPGTDRIPVMDTGGTVPGRFGQAVPIIAHGGEYIVGLDEMRGMHSLAASSGPVGGGPTIIIQGSVVAERQVIDIMRRYQAADSRHNPTPRPFGR